MSIFLQLEDWIWVLPNLLVIGCLYLFNSSLVTSVLGNRVMILMATYIMPIYLFHDSVMEFVKNQGGGWIWCMIWSLIVCVPYAIVASYLLGIIRKKQ